MEAAALSMWLDTCAPRVHPRTAHALIAVESGGNPYAIGVVGGTLVRQPRNLSEAVATARTLVRGGWSFSVGLAQINVSNWRRLGLDEVTAFGACANLMAMQTILQECFERAASSSQATQDALRRALSCYYSGNFKTGFRHGYVARIERAVRQWSDVPDRSPPRVRAAVRHGPLLAEQTPTAPGERR